MSVPIGCMVLYDRIDPALPVGRYRMRVETTVSLGGGATSATTVPDDTRYFDVQGPRFRLAATEVAGVFPPRNGHGPFGNALPHVALGRRTLPWERPLDPSARLAAPRPRAADDPPLPGGPPPWLALLLFETSEVRTLLTDVPVTDVLPAAVAADLAVAADDRCDAIEIDRQLLAEVLPSVEELHLLTHVREVNIDDRELSAGDSDGFFAVAMTNRIPEPGKEYRACLVSVEGRYDLLAVDPPPVAPAGPVRFPIEVAVDLEPLAFDFAPAIDATAASTVGLRSARDVFLPPFVIQRPPVRLVLLHSWTFECTGTQSFEYLARNVDVGMFGEIRGEHPVVTDTGHLAMSLRDRSGSAQSAWYRGPLAPFAVTRDDRGPYHTADQCRRVSPETGMEDISYAAAFELGRLLAASDARLAQELMRWRRVDYRRSVERSLADALRLRLPSLGALDHELFARLAGELARPWIDPAIARIDPLEREVVRFAPGLVADRLAETWAIAPNVAIAMLAPDVVAARTPIAVATTLPESPATIGGVIADTGGLGRLTRGHAAAQDLVVRRTR